MAHLGDNGQLIRRGAQYPQQSRNNSPYSQSFDEFREEQLRQATPQRARQAVNANNVAGYRDQNLELRDVDYLPAWQPKRYDMLNNEPGRIQQHNGHDIFRQLDGNSRIRLPNGQWSKEGQYTILNGQPAVETHTGHIYMANGSIYLRSQQEDKSVHMGSSTGTAAVLNGQPAIISDDGKRCTRADGAVFVRDPNTNEWVPQASQQLLPDSANVNSSAPGGSSSTQVHAQQAPSVQPRLYSITPQRPDMLPLQRPPEDRLTVQLYPGRAHGDHSNPLWQEDPYLLIQNPNDLSGPSQLPVDDKTEFWDRNQDGVVDYISGEFQRYREPFDDYIAVHYQINLDTGEFSVEKQKPLTVSPPEEPKKYPRISVQEG